MSEFASPTQGITDLTVFVIPLLGGEALAQCSSALASQGARVITTQLNEHAGCERPLNQSVPYLRKWALEIAETPYVGFVEDTATPGPQWCTALCTALSDGKVAVVAGPVLISPQLKPRYRALGLNEYAIFHPDHSPESSFITDMDRIPGIAFGLNREKVLPIVTDLPTGLVEGDLLRSLRACGAGVRYVALMEVFYDKPYPDGASLSTRYHHGRLYAGMRIPEQAVALRLGYAFATILLPIILTYRSLRMRPVELQGSVTTVFWILAMHTAWALGEFVGYITGSIGNSLQRWR